VIGGVATIVSAGLLALLLIQVNKPSIEERAQDVVRGNLRDPESARFREVTRGGEYTVCGEVNAKNALGGYVGFRRFAVEFNPQTGAVNDFAVDGVPLDTATVDAMRAYLSIFWQRCHPN
jgi:hypothetical protein